MKIVLLGFMGTGKTTTGRLLAERLDYRFLDTDKEIERQESCSIPDIFARKGEGYFRCRETQILKQLLSLEDDLVIAAGGGIVKSAENRSLLRKMATPILLAAPAEIIYQRTAGGGRPLLEQSERRETIRRLLSERAEFYREFTSRVDTGERSREEVVEAIIKLLEAEQDG